MTDALEFQLGAPQIARLAKAFRKAPEIALPRMVAAVTESQLLYQREVQERIPTGIGGGGGLKGSVSARDLEINDDRIAGQVGTPLDYAVPVELGSKPHMPPVQPLVDWAAQKFGLTEEEAKTAGWAIAMKIKAKGTEGVHMFRDAFEQTNADMEQIMFRAIDKLSDEVLGEVR